MRSNYRLSLFIAVILVLLLGTSLALAGKAGNSLVFQAGDMPWSTQYVHQVDYPEDVGTYVSLGIRPFDDLPYMSYYDSTNGNLMLAHLASGGTGNCGTNNNWDCSVLDGDNGDDVGSHSSLDFWSDENTNTWKIGVSYHDSTHGALKFITWTCSQNCTMHKIYTIADSDLNWLSFGYYTSFKFGVDGTPMIASYTSNTIGDDSLYFATYVGNGGNCGEAPDDGEWQCETIDRGDQVGQYASLDLTYDGSAYIAYYDAANGNLKLANYWGIIEDDCYDDNGWACPIIDAVGDVGSYASLVMQRFPTDVMYRIAYYNASTDQLMYTDGDLDPFVVDDMGSSISPMGISMDLDGNGFPVIAYQQISSEDSPPTLQVARPYMAYDDGNFGNCGDVPPGYLFIYWRCNTVDNAGQYLGEAGYVSVAVKSSGFPMIAYSEFYDYDIDDYATSLKITYQQYQIILPIVIKQ